ISIVVLAVFGWLNHNSNIHSPVDENDDDPISFQIKRGSSLGEVAKSLKENDLINSAFSFKMHAKVHNLDTSILAGRFVLSKSMDSGEILKKISDPKEAEFIITIQEGLEIRDIDNKLVELELIEPGDFISAVKSFNGWEYYDFLDPSSLQSLDLPLEGYIYPDTYFLDPADFEPHDLIYFALDNFENKFSDLHKEIKRHTVNEIITMASIIEREVFGIEDRKLVSGILWKRFENNWMIGADATLLYITEDNKISSADLALDSPYNTRKNAGLPPGPIGNPSMESIEAAMYPTSSEYWFYLTTLDTGEVIYAHSNEEHNVNKAKYL
ncbi:endolytic transglycosylase MltG, partial [Candidatus Peregrinibacteria bacterium]|nr:endolytic transglycosylase MltG [Candidatus Peregrinibacteria bacterium]